MYRTLVTFSRIAVFMLVLRNFGLAQNSNSGELKGVITDSSGSRVPGVRVVVLNVNTGVKTSTVTNDAGLYDVPSVPTGTYSITFSKTGFGDYVRNGIVLEVQTLEIDAMLHVGGTTQSVEVTAASPLLETGTSGQHATFNEKTMVDVPTSGRVWYNSVTQLIPGMNNSGSQAPHGSQVGVNGTQGQMANFLLNGGGARDPVSSNASDNYPPIDAIAEVNVQTSNFGAQYGGGPAVFNAILKSGTNAFHGSAYEFFQNDKLNARNFFAAKRPPQRWNEWGVTIGGPIKKDKLFFFFSYQRNPSNTSNTATYTYPSAAMRSGDFSGAGFPTIYDPKTGQPFVGNIIPRDRIDPVAAKIATYWPLPNKTGIANNYTSSVSAPGLSIWYTGAVDYVISDKQRLSGSTVNYPIWRIDSNDPLCPNGGSNCTPSAPNLNQVDQITHIWTINPTMVNEARISGMREYDGYVSPGLNKNYPAALGIEPAYGTNAPANLFPTISIQGNGAGAMSLASGTHAILAEGLYTASDVITLIRGRHTLKIGGEYDKNYDNNSGWPDLSAGNFTFSGIATGTNGKPGIAFADFLLGDVYSWRVNEQIPTSLRMWNSGVFIQDDFKVSQHVTLNLGLRWQMQSGWSEKHNLFGVFDPTASNPGPFTGCANGTCTAGMPGALVYGGTNGRNQIEGNNYKDFSPRIGIAWAPRNNWVLRASYGTFYTLWGTNDYTGSAVGVGVNPSSPILGNAQPSCQSTNTCAAFQLQTGPPPNSVSFPSFGSLSTALLNGGSPTYYQKNVPSTRIQEVVFNVQRMLPFNTLVEASYVYTNSANLPFLRNINQINILAGAKTAPYPQYSSIQAHLFDGYSNYNALQLRFEKRYSHGLSFVGLYAHSKTLDTGTTTAGNGGTIDSWQNAYNVRANYGLSKLDSPNTTTGQVTYEVPLGAGRTVALHGLLNQVLGGWRATGLFQLHSGLVFTPTMSADLSGAATNGCCGFAWYPNLVGDPSVANRTIQQWFNPLAYAAPATGTFGNVGRNTLRGPAYRGLDLSLGKSFSLPLRESSLEFRADMLNALNHPYFGLPGSSISPSSNPAANGAGVITSANNGGQGRTIQLGARLRF